MREQEPAPAPLRLAPAGRLPPTADTWRTPLPPSLIERVPSASAVKALSEFLGHSSIVVTLDRYGHLLPGSLGEATALLDAYLARTGERTGEREASSLQIET